MRFINPLSMPIRVTIGYYIAFIILGLFTSVMGPAIPDLAENTHSSLAELSRFLMAGSFGYLLGGFLGGRLYDHFRGHLILSAVIFISAVFLALIPLMPWLGLLGVVLLITVSLEQYQVIRLSTIVLAGISMFVITIPANIGRPIGNRSWPNQNFGKHELVLATTKSAQSTKKFKPI